MLLVSVHGDRHMLSRFSKPINGEALWNGRQCGITPVHFDHVLFDFFNDLIAYSDLCPQANAWRRLRRGHLRYFLNGHRVYINREESRGQCEGNVRAIRGEIEELQCKIFNFRFPKKKRKSHADEILCCSLRVLLAIHLLIPIWEGFANPPSMSRKAAAKGWTFPCGSRPPGSLLAEHGMFLGSNFEEGNFSMEG